ncbi:MAG: oligosaccharide flippase family protein [Ignavibacteriales bacterium]
MAKNSVIYSFGAVFLKGISFILIPLFTKKLIPAEYGQLELLNTFSSILSTVLSFGLGQVLFIQYYHMADDQKSKLVEDIVEIYLCLSSPLYLIVTLVVLLRSESFFGGGLPYFIVCIVTITTYLSFFQSLFYSVLKISQKALSVTINQVIVGIATLIFNMIMVVYLNMKVVGVVYANLIVMIISLIFPLYKYITKINAINLRLKLKKIMEYLKLGFPFVPGALAAWLIVGIDRWILLKYFNEYEVGIYSIAGKFASVFQILIILPILDSYMPFIFKKFSKGEYDQKMRYLLPMVILFSAAVGYVMFFASKYVVAKSYYPGLYLIPMFTVGYGFYLLSQIAIYPILFQRKTNLALLSMIGSSVLSVLLNFYFIPKYASKGAVYSFVASYILLFMINSYLSHKYSLKMLSSKASDKN